MKIVLLPAGDDDTASSRIRVYSLKWALASLGHTTASSFFEGLDILFIQKRVTFGLLELTRRAKAQGALIIYDIDDLGDALWFFLSQRLFYEMIHLADVITTDTEGHRDQLVRKYGVKRVEIIPDTIDYYPSGPVRPAIREGKPLRALWFGSCGNIALFEKYTSTLAAIPDVEVVVVTDPSAIASYSAKYPGIVFVSWSRDSFVATLQSCDLSCLMHDGSVVDRTKSNNKMIASITWGVPAVVSRTPEYERTARDAGIESALFSDEVELRAAIERLRTREARNAYLDQAQPDIWNRYAPRAVAMKFVEMATKYSPAATRIAVPARRKIFENEQRPLTNKLRHRIAFELWQFRLGEERLGIIRSMFREVITRVYHAFQQHSPIAKANTPGAYFGDSQPEYLRYEPYLEDHSNCKRRRRNGEAPAEFTVNEIRSTLRVHLPKSVLEVDCGSGRLLEELLDEFDVEGCDASQDLLKFCSSKLTVFQLDIAADNYSFLRENAGRWDVLFTREVMLDLMESPVQMANAMNNMLMLASKKILIWEWPEVCERMKQFSSSAKFEYFPIEHR